MPISSQYVGQMIAGQQAMFGNMTSYAQQISPGYNGPPVGYGYPQMGQYGDAYPPSPMTNPDVPAFGTQALSFMGHVGLPVMGGLAAASMGIDPFSMGLKGFARGAGFQPGVGVMSNLGRIASGGVGSIARAGLGGIAGGAMAAAPPILAGLAATYGVNQMVGGAQFANATTSFLNQNFRFQNQGSETGYGFSRAQGGEISSMMREMGSHDFYTSAGELLNVMKQGTGMGMFKAVQDVREFKTKFKEMVGVVKEIAMTMNTTLEGAMPFLASARQQGFWTPQDIMRSGTIARTTAATTGMTVAQTQTMMQTGSDMARQIGARGGYGAVGITRAANMIGGSLRSGIISEQELQEYTGLQGGEAVQAMATTLQGATTRFARGSHARWMMAAMAAPGFQGFDPAMVDKLRRGQLSIGQIQQMATQNISKGGAFNFVMNEERLRGELVGLGSDANLGFVKSLIGDRLFGEGSRDQYITRRIIQRETGKTGQEADMIARMMRDLPRVLQENQSRSLQMADNQGRDLRYQENETWEGIRRKIGKWWGQNVDDPLQKFGQEVSASISNTMERWTDKLLDRTPMRYQYRGMSERDVRDYTRSVLTGSPMGGTSLGARTWDLGAGRGSVGGMLGGLAGTVIGAGAVLTGSALIGTGFGAPAGALLAGAGIGMIGGSAVGNYFDTRNARRDLVQQWGITDVNNPDQGKLTQFALGLEASQGRGLNLNTAQALGFGSAAEGEAAFKAAQKGMGGFDYQLALARSRTEDDSAAAQRERAIGMVQRIRSGEIGNDDLRKLVGTGDINVAAMRLVAAQGGNRRAGDLSLGSAYADMGGTTAMDLKTAERTLAGNEEKLAAMFGATGLGDKLGRIGSMAIIGGTVGAIGGTVVPLIGTTVGAIGGAVTMGTAEAMKQFSGPDIRTAVKNVMELPDVRDAMRDIASDDPKKQEAGRAKLLDISLRREGTPEADILTKMAGSKDPEMVDLIRSTGAALNAQSEAGFADTMDLRARRFRQGMGGDYETGMEALEKTKSGGGEIGRIVRALTGGKETIGKREYAHYLQRLTEFGQTASEEDRQKAKAILARTPEGAVLAGAIGTGETSAELSDIVAKGGGRLKNRRGLTLLNELLGGMGVGSITDKELKGEKLESFLAKISAETGQQKHARELIEAYMGDPQGAGKIKDAGKPIGALTGIIGAAKQDANKGKGTLFGIQETLDKQLNLLEVVAKKEWGVSAIKPGNKDEQLYAETK